MKFICDGTILAEAAFIVSKACAVKTITPVLECIRLTAKNDGLTLKAYDGEIAIEKKIKAEIMDEGELCVNGKTFADFVNKISAFEVSVTSDEKGILIEYGDCESYMQVLPAKDFPVFGEGERSEEDYFEIKPETFKELVQKVVFCAATDDSRPILKGVLLEIEGETLTATALDGFRMAYSHAKVEEGSKSMRIVCPARTLTEISRMIDGEENLRIYASNNLLSVGVEDSFIISRLYLGEFVRKENIFPPAFETMMKVKKSELVSSVERASVLIRGDKNNLVNFSIRHGLLNITANSDMGKVEETISAELEGKELKISMNGKYLLDALKVLEEEEIVFSFNQPITPFTVENVENKNSQYLILPVRTTQPTAD